jgi:iron complex outermembrane receptor protein
MKFQKSLLSVVIAGSVCAGDLAMAQTSGGGFALEEIVVTARKREENLQNTPLSISAFTANELSQRQIRSTDQLADVTPNLTFDAFAPSSGQNSSSQIYIRGIGQSDFTAVTDPGVGLYIDGVYMARSIGGTIDFLDLERIEVLRGPQGTLFGRNTIGGAIALHTRRPDDQLAVSNWKWAAMTRCTRPAISIYPSPITCFQNSVSPSVIRTVIPTGYSLRSDNSTAYRR